MIKKILCGLWILSGIVQARKTKITLYNLSNETILIAIDTIPQRPLAKSAIRPQEAKNFFLPVLTTGSPYYCIIESSSESQPKLFMIRIDPKKHDIVLQRDDLVLASLPALILNETDRFIKIIYYGSMRPEIPEITFMR